MTFSLKLIFFVLENKAHTIQVNDSLKPLFSRLSLRAECIRLGAKTCRQRYRIPNFSLLLLNPRLSQSTGPNPNNQVPIWRLGGEKLGNNPC